MKKALSVLLALALIGSAAFAEISPVFSIGSYGKALWNIAATSGTESWDITSGDYVRDENIYSSIVQSWGQDSPRLALNLRAETDNVRLVYDIHNNGQSTTTGNNGYIEIRPFPVDFPFQAAISVGKLFMNETRIDAVYGMYNWYRIGSVHSGNVVDQEGFIFTSLLDHGNDGRDLAGIGIRLYPIQGLTIGAGVPVYYADNIGYEIGDTWRDANFYAAYELANIGKISLGWDGKWIRGDDPTWGDADVPYWGVIGAAIEFTMIDNLYVAVGGKIPTSRASSANADDGAPVEVNAYVRYNLGFLPLGVHVLFGSKILEWDTNSNSSEPDAFGFQIGIGVDYEVLDNVPIFLDVRYANGVYMDQASGSGNDAWTFGVGISRQWSNGRIGVAFELATNGYGYGYGYETYIRDSDSIVWAVPVIFEYQF